MSKKLFVVVAVVAGVLAVALALTIVYFNYRIDNNLKRTQDLVDLSLSREQFYVEWHERVSRQNQNEHMKSLYFNYASELIRQHYQRNASKQRQMRPDEIFDLLETIYCYTNSGVFPTASFPDGLFLPLAFACVETDFYPEVVGEDGERSIFQFMNDTARRVFEKNGRAYVDAFWLSPKESVWLWFNYYRELSVNFICDSKEREVRWSALAYNVGLYRNRLIPRFQSGVSVESYLREYPLVKGSGIYNQKVYQTYLQYKEGFKVFN